MVVTKTTQSFLESLHCWQEEFLSLTNLRQGFLKAFRQISIKTSIMHDPEKLPEESQNGVSLLFASDDGGDSPVPAPSPSSLSSRVNHSGSLTSLSIDTTTPTTLSFPSSLSSSTSSLSPLSSSTCYTGSSASSTCSTSSSSSASSYNLVPPATLESSISPTPPLPDLPALTEPLNTLLFNGNIAAAAAAAAAAATCNTDSRTICNYSTASNNNNTALSAAQFNLDELPFLKKCLYNYNNNNNNNNNTSSSSNSSSQQQQQLSADLLYPLDSSFVTDGHSSADWEESTFLLMREHIEGCLPSLSPCPSLQPNVYDLI
ncbi:Hypothetical predicted protein [Octopus vulgaris]|uniref:Uncharacterized protein n=1 Tax=Octopus vulgaris TaxID=6645 RepID=A0AA36FB82_OCTVU|nr:Hypothetical predicted protein [Octopus vulgaris]